jgi:hypothetical protein
LTTICGLPLLASSARSATPGTLSSTGLDLAGQAIERAQVFAVNLQGQGRAHAGDQFLDAHLDRLRVAANTTVGSAFP